MTTFAEIDIKTTYDSEGNNLVRDFYLPVLSNSVRYDRAVGYFSSSMLVLAAQGLSGLIENGGTMRLVIGEYLTDDEFSAIQRGQGLERIQDSLTSKLSQILASTASEQHQTKLNLLSWLTATNRLQIRFALKREGMYHEKIGAFYSENGDIVVFQGSANETQNALLPDFNFESVAVYRSWDENIFELYGKPFLNRLERLWNNQISTVLVIDVKSDFYAKLSSFRTTSRPPSKTDELRLLIIDEIENSISPENGIFNPSLPESIGGQPYELKSHQRKALQSWQANGYEGILALATGAGKTITAIHAIVKTHEALKSSGLFVIIAAPYISLADQWCEVLSLFCIRPIQCYEGKANWENQLLSSIYDLKLKGQEKSFHCAVVVNATLSTDAFQQAISQVPLQNLFFVGDECHRHSSPSFVKRIPKARYRLGLSATPWNPNDQDAQQILERIYGPIAATYSIDDALKDGILCRYEYFSHTCEMNDEEWTEYQRLSAEIAVLLSQKQAGKSIDESKLTMAYGNRSRLLGSIESKFDRLAEILGEMPPSSLSLFYCGEGKLQSGDRDQRSIEKVVEISKKFGWKGRIFTSDDSSRDRRSILAAFTERFIDALISMKVLDEGIDIPGCRLAFILASSRSHRQYVQRRGRILRRSADKSMAYIHDFFVTPPQSERGDSAKNLIRAELIRHHEFSRIAENSADLFKFEEILANSYQIILTNAEEEYEYEQ